MRRDVLTSLHDHARVDLRASDDHEPIGRHGLVPPGLIERPIGPPVQDSLGSVRGAISSRRGLAGSPGP